MKNILVIEDSFEIRESIAEILEISDYRVSQAENGKVGVLKAMRESPDLILCDVMMPELDGFGVLNILEKKPQTADIPFIFLTAKTDKRDFRRGMSLGADDYITKPFQALDLLRAVEMRLKKNERLKRSFWDGEQGIPSFFDEQKGRKELHNLSTERTIKKFKEKDTIYNEFEYPNSVFLVLSGQVKVVKSNDIGKEFIIDICQPGSFFGHNALIQEVPYSESAIAMENTEVSLIAKDDFLKLLYSNRNFSAMFIKMMAKNTLRKENQLITLAYSSNRKRVAQSLLFLLELIPEKCDRHQSLSVMRNDLAHLTGSAKETISRTLSEFKEEGLIDLQDGLIVIEDIIKLKTLQE